MDKNQASLVMERFIGSWNDEFPDYPLTALDLKKPQALMSALLLVFDRLGIDRDVIMAPPPEECRNEHLIYYADLLPVINMTRVVNYLLSFMKRTAMTISITHFLQPIASTSHSMLLLLFNLMIFYENRLRDIQPHEDVLFSKTDQVKTLEDKKNKLMIMLNKQAEDKAKRSERLQKLDTETKQLEEELRILNEEYEAEQPELEAILKEIKQMDTAIEAKKTQRDGLLAEIEKKRALRVYDADDVRAQAEQASQNVQDAEEKLKSLRETLMQKESCLKNLQTIKPNLDTANNVMHDIMKLIESLRGDENADLDTSLEGELESLNRELSEMEGLQAELKAARIEVARKRQEAYVTREQKRTVAHSKLRDAEERDKKCREKCSKVSQRTHQIKELTVQYRQEKDDGLEELARIQDKFTEELKLVEETLKKKVVEAKKKVEEKLSHRKKE